jgi:hypothetical protein
MKRLILGLIVVVALVLGTNLLTWRATGVSYDHFTWAAYAGIIYPETEDEVPGGCSDGIDNDLDGDIDCEDENCQQNVACGFAPAPVLSPGAVAVLLALLMMVGLFGIVRRRHQPQE